MNSHRMLTQILISIQEVLTVVAVMSVSKAYQGPSSLWKSRHVCDGSPRIPFFRGILFSSIQHTCTGTGLVLNKVPEAVEDGGFRKLPM